MTIWQKLKKGITRVFEAIFGDLRHDSIEHRIFNTLALLNAVTNIGGGLNYLDFGSSRQTLILFALHVGSGILFAIMYYFSRFQSIYRSLYWPFVITMLGFLTSNVIFDAGSLGGAHYYIIAAMVIATILSRTWVQTLMTYILFLGFTAGLYYVETETELVQVYDDMEERPTIVFQNFAFVQILIALVVQVLMRNLHLERRKSDALLLNVLPEDIAHELKKHDRVEPLHYEMATVLFTDFVGFTRVAEKLTPGELVSELDRCFREFDAIMRKHNMEKIKTIGDAYMAVGGLPHANETNAIDAVLAALEISRFMERQKLEREAQSQPYWELRLGLHTGPLIAGVIGEEKFAYDVWGDTVNTASRMESSGEKGRINISSTTYEHIREYFDCEYRGKIQAKNKGEIEMYFVRGMRPDLRSDAAGLQPNDAFLERYRLLR